MNILFLCTHNRCRSILSEAITRAVLGEQNEIRSAGTRSEGHIHPLTEAHLVRHGYETSGLFSKSFDGLGDFQPDIVVTVCESAAKDPCPVWPDAVVRAHWGLPDPTAIEGSDEEISQAFEKVIREIRRRAEKLWTLKLETVPSDEIQALLDGIVGDEG